MGKELTRERRMGDEPKGERERERENIVGRRGGGSEVG